MLLVSYIKENKENILKGLEKRNFKQPEILDQIIDLDEKRKVSQQEMDQTLSEINNLSKEIGSLFKAGKAEEANAAKTQVAMLKERSKNLKTEQEQIKVELEDLLLQVPNNAHKSVPPGNSDEDNEVHKDWDGELPDLGPDALSHWDLAKKYKLFDLELGVKITGAGFPLYRGKGAKLQRALIAFFLDEADAAGYEEIIPPHVVNEASCRGTGQIPDKEGQMYYMPKDDLYLIPTGEVPITNIYRDVILNEKDFPIKLVGYTPCFRREVGSYGAHVRGLNRVHQFDKVEIVHISHPKDSYKTLERMIAHVESLVIKLGLPYRILRLCGGDLGFASALTYDFEVYSLAQKRWLEVSSVSNFETFQSNRMNLRYKDKDNKKHLAHTLNGSALALARIMAAVLENYQTSDGIDIPEVLKPYLKFDKISE